MPYSGDPPDSWARDVEVFRAADLNGPWESIGRAELPNTDTLDLPTFVVQPAEDAASPSGLPMTQYVKVVVYSNWGNPSFCSLSEVQASGG